MEMTCYICNKNSKFYHQNLTEIQSKHSGKRICDFIKQFMRDVVTVRNVEDELNSICVDCLKDVLIYDCACVEAASKEKKLIELLLMTENSLSKNRVEIKVEKDIGHTESIFVEENHDLVQVENIETKSEPELILEDEILMETPPEINAIETLSTVASPNPTVMTQQQNNTSSDKTRFIQKDGKLVKIRLVKCNSNIKPINGNILKTPDGKPMIIKFAGNNIQTPPKIIIPKFAGPNIQRKIPEPKIIESIQREIPIQVPIQELVQMPIEESVQLSIHTTDPVPTDETMPKLTQAKIDEQENSSVRRWPCYKYPRECKICNDGVMHTKIGYALHMRHHKKVCPVCDMQFKSTRYLTYHMKWHDSHPGFVCRICHYELEDKMSYKEHIMLHNDKKPLTCVLCEKVFKSMQNYRRHIQTVHCKLEYLCDICGKKCSTVASLRIHKDVHIEGRTEKCPKCSKAFKNKNYLTKHIRRHMASRKFACSFCHMKFKRNYNLRVHERRHREDTKTVKCSFCPAAYEHKFHLKEHIKRKHSAEQPSGNLDGTESNRME